MLERSPEALLPQQPRSRAAKRRLLVLLTEFYFFRSIKREIVPLELRDGFEIHVAARGGDLTDLDREPGINIIDLDWKRSSSMLRTIFAFIPEILRIRALLREVKPDLLLNVALKPSVIGGIAAMGTGIGVVHTVTGFGFLFHARSLLAHLVQMVFGAVFRLS